MRILRIIASANPAYGGPIEALKQTTSVLSMRGHVTEVVTLDEPKEPWVKNRNLIIHAIGPSTRVYNFCPRLVPWLKHNCNRFDIIIQHGLWNYTSFATWYALRSISKAYYVYPHGMLDPWFRRQYPLKHVAKQFIWWIADGLLLRDARAVFFTSQEERLSAHNGFWPYHLREIVATYGTADAAGDPGKQLKAFKQFLPKLYDHRYLLFLGRVHKKKGCDLLIRAFASLASKYPDLDLVIAGPDQVGLQAELERIAHHAGIPGRIHWPGMLQGDLKWGAFRGCEAFVLPSHQENFGMAVAEALSCGRPVLLTNKVNIWREVERAGAGLVSNDDYQGVYELLCSFLEMPKGQSIHMGTAARRLFLSSFEITKVADDLLATISAIESDANDNAQPF
jgi:glycosyltransferase involved in cell wall biosynthesis